MYNGQPVIDVHGHLSATSEHRRYAANLIFNRTIANPPPKIPDEAMARA